MSNLLGPVDFEAAASSCDKEFKPKLFNSSRKLKSKENIFKPKLHRELKKKLKKYKLRRDGQEDPEVLDVSQILVSSLKIKSPNNNISNTVSDIDDEVRPKNYLFKMGRKKQAIKKKVECSDVISLIPNNTNNKNNILNGSDNCVDLNTAEETHANHENDVGKKNKDKKQTNAFLLMMDSRNKSIGGNSPGKEKVADDVDQQASIEKKNIKAKRNLLLQKMAESKGSLKKKEIEELQEKCIKKKMDKRAERLKNMIEGIESKPIKHKVNKETAKGTGGVLSTKDLPTPPVKCNLKVVNIFHDLDDIPKSMKEKVTNQDDEFLKKLSPSLKKKENMLYYFKKVEKEHDEMFGPEDSNESSPVIKVKLKSKLKNKIKKKKLSLNKKSENQDEKNINNEVILMESSSDVKQTKCVDSCEKINFSKNDDSSEPTEFDIMRPKRNVKRPAKYIDDMQFSSSDEDLHIFTPKKKKHVDKQNIPEGAVEMTRKKPTKFNDKKPKEPVPQKGNTKVMKEVSQPSKNTKLAPIFATKPLLDAAALEAKQKFLSSGVPDKLKKNMEKQTNKSMGTTNHFHAVVHVQQKQETVSDAGHKFECIFTESILDEDTEEDICEKDFFKNILQKDSQKELFLAIPKNKTQSILQNMKEKYPQFPVYRTYRLLKDKNRGEFIKDCSYLELDNSIEVINGMIDLNNETPDRLNWTDKYKAMSSKQIIGNFESIKELKKWLISWTENDNKPKKNENNSDSSDFYVTDTDSKDSIKSTNNLLVINGPVGTGKTSLVYAVAAELAIKVLEVNASNKRTGKIMLQDLQEATQSHKVNRGKSSQGLTQKSQEIKHDEKPKVKKRGRPKKNVDVSSKKTEPTPKIEVSSQPSSSQDNARTCMSLILIDDADIVFEQDDGFCAAIVQLVQCSKRPVILITSSMTCPHLQRFLQCAKIIHTRPLSPRMLGTWLDIMCLADSGSSYPGLGAKCLDYFKGDIRKAINFLQFHIAKDLTIEDDSNLQNSEDYCKANIEDENSSMSWTDREDREEKNEAAIDSNVCVAKIMRHEASLLSFNYPLNVSRVWWNIPRLLTPTIEFNKGVESLKTVSKLHLDTMSNVADIISIADCYCRSTKDLESRLVSAPWVNFENDSVSENECMDRYDRICEIANEISHTLLSGTIMKAQNDMCLKTITDLQMPEMSVRRERSRVVDRHIKLSTFLSPSAVLDRRALALDYWSGCRSICRVEKSKTDSNWKRNNRFCHYLKSANILCKSDSFDNLANSLYCKDY